MKSRFTAKGLALLGILIAGLCGCNMGGDNMGQLSLALTDKPTHDYKEVWVTIRDIYVHAENDAEGSWTKILDVNRTVDLLTLSNGVRLELGMVELAAGHYTQMRLMVGTVNSVDPGQPANFIVDTKDQVRELKVPSGVQSGIKLVQGFDINENSTTELIFDFDVAASVVAAGNSGKYILRPTIHQIDYSQTRAIVQGFVRNAEGAGIPGAEVSLQIYKPRADGQDYKDEITRYGATVTDSEGAYMFWFLNIPDPLTFNAVASQWNSTDPYYAPDWEQIAGAVNGGVYPVPFTLPVPAETGTLDLTAVVADGDTVPAEPDTLFVTLSIRQLTDLPGAPMVEVKRQDIVGYDDDAAPGDPVKIDLPVGSYVIVASIDGRTSVEMPVTITKAGPNALIFVFPAI
jgi:hypothetical protein